MSAACISIDVRTSRYCVLTVSHSCTSTRVCCDVIIKHSGCRAAVGSSIYNKKNECQFPAVVFQEWHWGRRLWHQLDVMYEGKYDERHSRCLQNGEVTYMRDNRQPSFLQISRRNEFSQFLMTEERFTWPGVEESRAGNETSSRIFPNETAGTFHQETLDSFNEHFACLFLMTP